MKFHFLYTTALAYSCNQIKANNLEYDIASLFPSSKTITLQTIKHEAISEDVYELKYNFCNSITNPGGDKNDFCADGTWACRLIKNNKNSKVRITSAKLIGSSEPTVTTNGDILGLRLMAENGSVTLNIKCKATVTDSTPTLTSYKDDDIVLNWEHAAGCNTALSTPNSSSNIFAALFFYSLGGLFAYFAIGSIANYVLKGETRFPDILPHSDFWVALGATVWVKYLTNDRI
ncbi:hypothetical protein HK103_001038 [Boothiomyces macroporosus]|uniref:Autophagy-related protein 27 n=1 Tax=Boothiomyces macroporosus TaxID=261099 RepID=A0AAD5Y146_9FUNG|nr:hypothetical protein HK103_001038 [Boothiomyces macroporosus]